MTDATVQIVLGLDGQPARAAVEAAALLAERLRAEVHALFVEDEQLLQAARLPSPAWIAHTGTVHALNAETIECALRAAALRRKQELADAARRSDLRWTFRVCRGRMLGELALTAAGNDLVVIPSRRASDTELGPGTMAALLDDAARSPRVLDLLDALAPRGPSLLLVPPTAQRELLERALDWVERRGRRANVRRPTGVTPMEVAEALRGARPALLLLAAGGPASEKPNLSALREDAPCPLVMVH